MSSSTERRRKRRLEKPSPDQIPEYICPICNVQSQDKHCFHYGGICCYSCRAFFRRAHQETKTPAFKCKKNNECEISVKTRRKCQRCRYDLCLKAGMDPDLVLSEEQKKVRFRNYLKKKAKTESDRESQSSGVANNPRASMELEKTHENREMMVASAFQPPSIRVPRAHDLHSCFTDPQLEQEQPCFMPRTEMHFKVNVTRPAHVFGSGSNEASYLPVLAIMSQVKHQTGNLEAQPQAEHHPLKRPSEQMTSGDPEVQYYRRIKERASFLEASCQRDYESDDSVAAAKQWQGPEYLAPSSKRQKLMDMQSHSSANLTAPLSSSSFQQLSSMREKEEPQDEALTLTSVFTDYQKHQLIAKLRKSEVIQQNYFLAMAQVDTMPEFIDSLQLFHSGKKESLSREDILSHFFRLASQFQEFANKEADFHMLTVLDQHRLLQGNASLFLMYVFARYIGAKSGEEQLHWLLDENMPRNLSCLKLELIDFDSLNKKLNLFSDGADRFEVLAKSVADIDLAFHCTGLVAYLLLNCNCGNYSHMELEESSKVNANFVEALGLLKYCHVQLGRPLQTDLVLKMIKSLGDMSDIFHREAGRYLPRDLPPLPFLSLNLPFTEEEEKWVRKELQWFSPIWEKISLPADVIDVLIGDTMHRRGSEILASQLVPVIAQLLFRRLRQFALNHPQFRVLTIPVQNTLWGRNCFPCLMLCLLRMEACYTGHEQICLLMGWPEEMSIRQDSTKSLIDPARIKRIDIGTGMLNGNSVQKIPRCPKEHDMKKFKALAAKIGLPFLKDEINFQLILSATLLDGEAGLPPYSEVAVLQDNFMRLLDRRMFKSSDVTSWRTGQALSEVTKLSAAMMSLIECQIA